MLILIPDIHFLGVSLNLFHGLINLRNIFNYFPRNSAYCRRRYSLCEEDFKYELYKNDDFYTKNHL